MRAATRRLQVVPRSLVESSHTKVGNFDLAVGLQKDVFWLQVAVADVELVVDVVDGGQDLVHQGSSLLFAVEGYVCECGIIILCDV